MSPQPGPRESASAARGSSATAHENYGVCQIFSQGILLPNPTLQGAQRTPASVPALPRSVLLPHGFPGLDPLFAKVIYSVYNSLPSTIYAALLLSSGNIDE